MVADGRPTGATGVGLVDAEVWLDASALARLEVREWQPIVLQAQAELIAPITQYRFAFEHLEAPIYQVPPLAAAASLGLGLEIW
jgi:hypothetical protein